MVILPVSLLADDTGAAMLRSNGKVLLNGNNAPVSSALFPDDLIQTPKDVGARIEATGSTADINPETVVQFEGNELSLDHGSLSVSTSRGMRVRVGCLTITPANPGLTQYDVTDIDGKVTVAARKNDVNIDESGANPHQAKQAGHTSRVTVREGEQKSREEKCGAAEIRQPSNIAGQGAIMNSPWVKGAGLAIIGGVTCWALCRGDEPVSPSHP